MNEILRWVLVALGTAFFVAGFPIIQFRVRLSEWQQAQNEKIAPAKSGPFGPGRSTPRQQLIVGIVFIIFGAMFALTNVFRG